MFVYTPWIAATGIQNTFIVAGTISLAMPIMSIVLLIWANEPGNTQLRSTSDLLFDNLFTAVSNRYHMALNVEDSQGKNSYIKI
ncbi:uncharacterized protein N7469_001871 [Penicillium citrinum]|uniref:Uncharacterized protein n=2 Tax=Penicillium TaxID=5073 RepID=A0A9W9PFA5_PENCI|nr:uncharacterized protein N7469_001871 [Penicillium citrinum]KAJ5243544.1 hypothetical protein N7469_001871 [Penicillium citrinum]KAJ5598946.1 hypothetical protein N7450_000013 [Penicillium hetheringtonii]KAK5805760.1 hypothetical protein VI817_000018 [Penicillium citrinum]